MGSLVPTKRQGIAVRALMIQVFEVPITSRFSQQLPSLFINLCITSLRYANVKVILWFRTVATRWSIADCILFLKKLPIPACSSLYSWIAAWQILISILVIPVYQAWHKCFQKILILRLEPRMLLILLPTIWTPSLATRSTILSYNFTVSKCFSLVFFTLY